MKKITMLLAVLALQPVLCQDSFTTRDGRIAFNASTPLEDIQAVNEQVSAIYISKSGALGLVLLAEEFIFPRSLMQEHFNENYMESETYPKATFRGRLEPAPGANPARNYEGNAVGQLTLHGVSREVSLPVSMEFLGEQIRLSSAFVIRPEDYGIEVPKLLFTKIAREVQVAASMTLTPETP